MKPSKLESNKSEGIDVDPKIELNNHSVCTARKLRRDSNLTRLFIIALAVTILNTMPIWLAELAVKSGSSDVAVGVLASVVLLSAAGGCVVGSGTRHAMLPRVAGGVAFCGIAGAAIAPVIATVALFAGAVLVGLSIGVVLAMPLTRSSSETGISRMIGTGMAIGCAASFVLLAGLHATGIPLLPQLALLAAIQAVLVLPEWSKTEQRRRRHINWKQDLSLLPFFICMGAYWAFLEVFAVQHNLGSLSAWLAGSLLLSALGSFLAGILPNSLSLHARVSGLLLAASAGGVTYVSKTELWIGTAILLNAFGLFLFFPLYLDKTDAPAAGMARYLLGFALGGGVGGGVIALAGYPVLAAAVAVSGLVALPALVRRRSNSDVPGF